MTREEFLDKQYEISVTAGMNQRYHQRFAMFWWRCDTVAKVTTAVMAVAGAMVAVAAMFEAHPASIDHLGIVVASVAALAAVILNVVPFGTWEQEHRDLLRQWTNVREEIEGLLFDCIEEPLDHHLWDLKKLDAKVHRLCGEEPGADERILMECFKSESASRLPGKQSQAA